MAGADSSFSCPFCDFVDEDSYFLIQHVELIHPEGGDSPFIVKDVDPGMSTSNGTEGQEPMEATTSSLSSSPESYVACPYKCGEEISPAELSAHTDFHIAERMAFDEADILEADSTVENASGSSDEDRTKGNTNNFTTDIPKALRNREQVRKKLKRPAERWSFRDFFLGPADMQQRTTLKKSLAVKDTRVRRLGRSELGPYAHERQMPSWLRKMLEDGAKVTVYNKIGPNGSLVRVEVVANETPDLIPVLARLSELDKTVERAFYCSPEVRHVVKMQNEGGFCGYRNIQMLVSYIRDAGAEGSEHFKDKIPSILKLQDMIENAWDMGFNTIGKIETGGIRGTRKYIGTLEAQALFQSLLIPCQANVFSTYSDLPGYEALLLAVGDYFIGDSAVDPDQKLHMTSKPPIYFQHQGHSMTIVGIEVRRNRSANLVVFDPMFKPAPALLRLRNSPSFRVAQPDKLLRAHRRGPSYLERYKDFEILQLSSTEPCHKP